MARDLAKLSSDVRTLQDEQAELRDELHALASRFTDKDYLRAVKYGNWAAGTQTFGSGAAASDKDHSVKA